MRRPPEPSMTRNRLRTVGSVLLLSTALLSGCILSPYECVTESRFLDATASFALPASDSASTGTFGVTLLQSRGGREGVSLSYGFHVGERLQDSVASATIHGGQVGADGAVLLEVPTYPGPDGGPERVFSGLAPSEVPGPLSGPDLISALSEGPAHLRLTFLASEVSPLAAPLQVDGPTEWRDSCT